MRQIGRPIASVGEDAAIVVDVLGQDVDAAAGDDELDLAVAVGHARHAGRLADPVAIPALPAGLLVRHIGLEDRLIFRRERRFLLRTPGLADVVPPGAADRQPLALQVRIFRVVEDLRAGARYRQRRQCDRTEQAAVSHDGSLDCFPSAWPIQPVPAAWSATGGLSSARASRCVAPPALR